MAIQNKSHKVWHIVVTGVDCGDFYGSYEQAMRYNAQVTTELASNSRYESMQNTPLDEIPDSYWLNGDCPRLEI